MSLARQRYPKLFDSCLFTVSRRRVFTRDNVPYERHRKHDSLCSRGHTYARCFGKPSCRSVCNGVKCCFEIFVGVGFFRGGSVAMTAHYCVRRPGWPITTRLYEIQMQRRRTIFEIPDRSIEAGYSVMKMKCNVIRSGNCSRM